MLERIAHALSEVQGAVLITGHSDNVPIRSLRFPSNWQLSTARAEAVKAALAATVAPQRMRAEGRADAEPVASNDTADGRAQNRRVDIVLFTNPAGAPAAGSGAR
ncbi:OmpA family protein [Ottowia pentelensis]|uniref:OmpA family protein n=1 Tax=Ottowia pentelensis TaxID=511108 RepID=UPI00364480E4